MLTAEDRKQLEEKGISESQLNEQLACFRSGFPYLKLSAPASVEKGILQLSGETASYEAVWEQYVGEGHKVVKFVPASGAASRMFKNMFAFLQAEYDEPTTDFEKKFFAEVHRFAFFDDLDAMERAYYALWKRCYRDDRAALKPIRERVRQVREARGISAKEIAGETFIRCDRIERGDSYFGFSTIRRLCDYLGITLAEFFSSPLFARDTVHD